VSAKAPSGPRVGVEAAAGAVAVPGAAGCAAKKFQRASFAEKSCEVTPNWETAPYWYPPGHVWPPPATT
jgi:hypothetical protein